MELFNFWPETKKLCLYCILFYGKFWKSGLVKETLGKFGEFTPERLYHIYVRVKTIPTAWKNSFIIFYRWAIAHQKYWSSFAIVAIQCKSKNLMVKDNSMNENKIRNDSSIFKKIFNASQIHHQIFVCLPGHGLCTIPGHQQGARCKAARSDEWGV